MKQRPRPWALKSTLHLCDQGLNEVLDKGNPLTPSFLLLFFLPFLLSFMRVISTMVLLSTFQVSRAAASHTFFRSFSAAASRRSCRAASLGSLKYSRTHAATSLLTLRGGAQDGGSSQESSRELNTSSNGVEQQYVTLSDPAPGSREFVLISGTKMGKFFLHCK